MSDEIEYNESKDSVREAPSKSDAAEKEESRGAQEDATSLALSRNKNHREGRGGDSVEFLKKEIGGLILEGVEGAKKILGKLAEAGGADRGLSAKAMPDGDSGIKTQGAVNSDASPKSDNKIEASVPPKPGDGGSMGAVGDRSPDAGVMTQKKVEVVPDSKGDISTFKMPDGSKYQVDYAEDKDGSRKPIRIIMPDADGRPRNYTFDGKQWVDRDTNKPCPIEDVTRQSDGSIKITQKNYESTNEAGKTTVYPERQFILGKDGSFTEKKLGGADVYNQIDKDGTTHKFKYANEAGTVTKTETTQKPDSHIAEVTKDGKPAGYEVRDDQGHLTKVELAEDGKATVTRDGRTEKYDKAEFKDGVLKLSGGKDGTSLEVQKDGTEISRKGKHITQITNCDGETTTFDRDASGKVKSAVIKDGQGIERGKSDKVTINDTDGSYKLTLKNGDGNKYERKADGTEQVLDKNDKPLDRGEKLAGMLKDMTPERQLQLKQDLADIDKLPKEQREKIYASLEKIATSKEPMKLTDQQRSELVSSLAHQIAHPESIHQGAKATCAVASVEQTMARNHPETYAEMVSSLATEGQYKTADGRIVKAQGSDNKTLDPKSDAYGQRSYTSELFQNAGAQLGLTPPKEYVSYGPQDYARLSPRPAGVDPSTDNGDRVIDRSKNPPTVEKFPPPAPPNPAFDAERQAEILNHLVPDGKKYKASDPITSPEALGEAAKKNGLPLNVGIHLGKEEFSGMAKDGKGAASTNYHAVAVTHIEYEADGKTPKTIYYENTAGGTDHSYPHGKGVPAKEFTDAMQSGNKKMQAVVPGEASAAKGDKPSGSMGSTNSRAEAAREAAPADDVNVARAKPTDASARPQRKPEEYPESKKPVDAAELKKIQESKEVKDVHKELDKEIGKLPPEQQERFSKQMEAFEKRAASEKPPLSPEEVARTEKAVLKLLQAKDGKIDRDQRVAVAEQVLLHAAYPSSIDQGGHSTCSVTAMENRMFAKHPAAAAEMISEASITGKYTYEKGPPAKTIDVPADSLKPHPKDGEESGNPPKDNQRSQASQIFQVTATNLSLEKHGVDVKQKDGTIKHYDAGTVQYRQGEPDPNAKPPTTGEQLVTKPGGEPIKDAQDRPIQEPRLSDDQQVELYKEITKTGDGILLVNEGMVDGKGEKVNKFKNEEEFKKQLEQAAGPPSKFPIVMKVYTGVDPFFSDSGGGSAGGSGGGHVVTITGYDPKTGEAIVDNQWGKGSDHPVKAHDLFLASQHPKDSVPALEKDCADAAKAGKPDYNKELDLLRMKRSFGDPPMSQEAYDKNVLQLTKQIVQDAKDNKGGTIDKATCTELNAMLGEIMKRRGTKAVTNDIGENVAGAIARGAMPGTKQGELKDKDGDPIKLDKDYASKGLTKEADEVYRSLNWWNEPERLQKALEGKTPSQIAEMDKIFKARSDTGGKSMEEYIKADTDGDVQKKALAQIHPEQKAPAKTGSFDTAAKDQGGKGPSMGDVLNQAKVPGGDKAAPAGDKGSDKPPPLGKTPEQIEAEKSADAIFTACNGDGTTFSGWGTDEKAIFDALKDKTPEQIEAIKKAYNDKYAKDGKWPTIDKEMDDELSGDDYKRAMELLNPKDKGSDRGGDKTTDSPEKDKVEKLAEKIKDEKEREQFKKDIAEFENRKPPVTPEEKAKFYKEVSRLMEAQDNPKLKDKLPNEEQRIKIAQQIMHNAAHPDSINQGKNGTCGAASLESRMYTTNPAAAAKMVTDVTTKGFFDTPPPENLRVNPHKDTTFKGDEKALKAPPPDPATDDRNLASQIFQTTAISIVKPGYEKRAPDESNSTGEWVVTKQKFLSQPEEKDKFTGVNNDDVRKMEKAIAGGDNTKTPIIDNARSDKSSETITVKNEQELHDKLKQLKGPPSQLPVVVAVQTQHPPFLQDSGAGVAGGSGAGHYVTITEYDPDTRTATMDNQWGKSNDHTISTRELYIATTDPKDKDTVKDIEQAIKEAKKEGKDTTSMELDLLKTKHEMAPPMINDAQYKAALNKVMLESEKQWQKSGKPPDAGKIRLQYFASLADTPGGEKTAEQLYGTQGKQMVEKIRAIRKGT